MTMNRPAAVWTNGCVHTFRCGLLQALRPLRLQLHVHVHMHGYGCRHKPCATVTTTTCCSRCYVWGAAAASQPGQQWPVTHLAGCCLAVVLFTLPFDLLLEHERHVLHSLREGGLGSWCCTRCCSCCSCCGCWLGGILRFAALCRVRLLLSQRDGHLRPGLLTVAVHGPRCRLLLLIPGFVLLHERKLIKYIEPSIAHHPCWC